MSYPNAQTQGYFQNAVEAAAEIIADALKNNAFLSDDSADYSEAHLQVMEFMIRRRLNTYADGEVSPDYDPSSWSNEQLDEFFNDISAYEGPQEHLLLCGFTQSQVDQAFSEV